MTDISTTTDRPAIHVDREDWDSAGYEPLTFGDTDGQPILTRWRERFSIGNHRYSTGWRLSYNQEWTTEATGGAGFGGDHVIGDVDEDDAIALAQEHLISVGYHEPDISFRG